MSIDSLRNNLDPPPESQFGMPGPRSIASYERELLQHRNTVAGLREALAQDKALPSQKDTQLQHAVLFS